MVVVVRGNNAAEVSWETTVHAHLLADTAVVADNHCSRNLVVQATFGDELQVVVAFLLAVDCIVDNSSLGLDYGLEVDWENAVVLVLLAEALVQDPVVVDLIIPELVDNCLES